MSSAYDRPSRSSRRDPYDDPAPPPSDDYDRQPRRSKRGADGPIDPPPLYDAPPDGAAPLDDEPPPTKSHPRSALRDPSGPRRDRSDSQVRVQEPDANDSDGSIEGHYVRHRDGRVDFIPDDKSRRGGNPRDLERKNGPDNRRFRDKRNGYESDEGEQLRRERRRRADDDAPARMPPANGSNNYDLPERPRRRPDRGDVDPVAAGAGGAAAGYGAARSSRRPPPDRNDDPYDDEPPRARRPRPRPRSTAYDEDPRYHERGYDSERPRRRRSAWDDEDPDLPPRRSARPPRDPYDDPRPRRRYADDDDDYYDAAPRRSNTMSGRSRRSRYDDPRDPRDPRAAAPGGADWKNQGMELFKTHAMPVIRQEGGRMIRKQLQNFIANGGIH